MATVFLSHATKDDALTGDLLRWLHENGFRDTFVDHLDILGGDNWTDRLRDQAAACRVVICVLTGNWLNSSDCFNEFQAAWYMGKSILPLFFVDIDAPGTGEPARRLGRVLAESQGIDLRGALAPDGTVDLSRDPDTADLLARSLRAFGAQSEIGLDPTAFSIDPAARPTPFPGLVSFGDRDADAAIFYGRSREIAEAIEELRSMRANADRRPLAILGVSGAGKSSFLKAGVIPRLRREPRSWLPLRVFRPGIDALDGFARAISQTLADHGAVEAPGEIRAMLEGALASDAGADALVELLDRLAEKLRSAAGTPGATILISVDQVEELLRDDSPPAAQLIACLAAASEARRGWMTAMTIRADRLPDLQAHPGFGQLKTRGYDLRQMPPFRFSDVMEQPAARYGVRLAPELVDALMDDAPERDALPLLAFALQRLWDQFSADKELLLDDYQRLGRLSGLLRDAAERALAGVAPGEETGPPQGQPKDRAALAERCFIPALVDVDADGKATRRTALWAEFSPEEQSLLRQFEAWRLIVRRGVGEEATVEVAHEALFREWDRMQVWLEPEIARIATLRAVSDAARAWEQSGRNASLLTHRGQRLSDARALLADLRYRDRLGATERAYLAACARLRRRGILTTSIAAGVAVAAVGLGTWSYLQSERRMVAEREAGFTERVETAMQAQDISTLESFTYYILQDPYARTRDDRFAILRRVLSSARATVDPEYAIADFALEALVLDTAAVDYFFRRFPEAYDITVDEYLAIRGPHVREDMLAWLDAGHSLDDMLFSLGLIASHGPAERDIDMAAAHEGAGWQAGLYMHGPIRRTREVAALSEKNDPFAAGSFGQSAYSRPSAPASIPDDRSERVTLRAADASDATEAVSGPAREATDPLTAPVRLLLPTPDAGQPFDTWHPVAQALYRDRTLQLSDAFLDTRDATLDRLRRKTGLVTLDIAVRSDARLGPGDVAVEILDSDWSAPLTPEADDPAATIEAVFRALETRVLSDPARFVFPHDMAGYLDTAAPGRKRWALETFAHTDLMQLVAGLVRHETSGARPNSADAAHLPRFDWLLGALVFSVAAHGVADGEAHLTLWRDLSDRAARNDPVPTAQTEVGTAVADGVAHLLADDLPAAKTAFERAIALDAETARNRFLAAYAAAAPVMLADRLRDDCRTPTRPDLGRPAVQQLDLVLDTALPRQDSTLFGLCRLAAQDKAGTRDWLDSAIAYAATLRSEKDLTPDQAVWLGRTIWQRHEPLSETPGALAVGQRFLLGGISRVDDPARTDTLGQTLATDCYDRIDTRPCMRRVMALAEQAGKPEIGLFAAEALAASNAPADRQRVTAMLDLFQAARGLTPDYAGPKADWYAAYVSFLRGLVAQAAGDSGAKAHLTAAMVHPAFRFAVLPALTRATAAQDGPDAARALVAEALAAADVAAVDPTNLANLHALNLAQAIEAGTGDDLLSEMVALPRSTDCLQDYTGPCAAPWLWRAAAQVLYRYQDWQTVARTVTDRVDHPYAKLVALMLYAQGGELAGAPALLRRNWQRVDPSTWDRRLDLEDDGVWREVLLAAALGEEVEGYALDRLLAILQDPARFDGHGLSKIGLARKELLTEALFYSAMRELAGGRAEDGVTLLRQTRDAGDPATLEYAYAKRLLAQLEQAER
ncbi:MAG: toll/interleukin-1 receptor domain-containing protein [Roseovarius sp.]